MIGGVQYAVREMQDLLRKYGTDTVRAALNYTVENTERRFRDEIARWPDGIYQATTLVDEDTQGTPDVKGNVAIPIDGDPLTADLTVRPIIIPSNRQITIRIDTERRYADNQIGLTIDGQVVMVNYKDGEKKIVIPSDAVILAYAVGDKAELKPGAHIAIVRVLKKPDGGLETNRVNVGRGGVVPQ